MQVNMISQFLGILFTVIAISIFLNREHAKQVMQNVAQHHALQFISGMIPLIIGTAIVVMHNDWHMKMSIFVTIMGWILLLHGVFRLWFSKIWVKQLYKLANTRLICLPIIVLLIGILFLSIGFYYYPSGFQLAL